MPDPKNEQFPDKAHTDPPPTKSENEGLKFEAPLLGGNLSGGIQELEPGVFLGNADYQFKNGDFLGSQFRLNTGTDFAFEQYGLNGRFVIGKDGNGAAAFRVDGPANTATFDTKLKFNEDYSLNGDWTRTAAGQIYGADGTFKLGKDGNGTANFRVDEPANTAKFDTKLKFNEDYSLNGDWTRTAAGQIYGADGTFKLGKDGKIGRASCRERV